MQSEFLVQVQLWHFELLGHGKSWLQYAYVYVLPFFVVWKHIYG